MSGTTSGWRKVLRWAGLILALLVAGGLSLSVWASAGKLSPWPFILVIGLIVIGSVATAWKWELTGGILLIAEGLFTFTQFRASGTFPTPTFGGLLFLVAGFLFLASWWIGRRTSKNKGD